MWWHISLVLPAPALPHWLHLWFTSSSLFSQIPTRSSLSLLHARTHHVKTVCGSISTWAVSAHCFSESLGHNSYQDKSQGSFLPSSILFLPLPSWTAELAWFKHQLVAHVSGDGGEGGWEKGKHLLTVCLFIPTAWQGIITVYCYVLMCMVYIAPHGSDNMTHFTEEQGFGLKLGLFLLLLLFLDSTYIERH